MKFEKIGNHILINGDTNEVMGELSKNETGRFNFDYILTSPPYNAHRTDFYKGNIKINDSMTPQEHIDWLISHFKEYNKLLKKAGVVIFNMNYMSNKKNNDKFKEQHYKRTMKSHLGAENTGNTLATFNLDKTQTIFLMHLSSGYNANPTRFKEVITTKLQKANKPIPKILICDKKGNIV